MQAPFTGTLSYWFLQTVAMALTALLIPGLRITSIFGAAAAVVGLALVNATVWDAALFFSVPHTLSTQMLVLLVRNGVIFWVLVKLLPGIEVDGILPALAAPIVFTIVSILISNYGREVDWTAVIQWASERIVSLRDYLTRSGADAPSGP
jgi:putative membrane protein